MQSIVSPGGCCRIYYTFYWNYYPSSSPDVFVGLGLLNRANRLIYVQFSHFGRRISGQSTHAYRFLWRKTVLLSLPRSRPRVNARSTMLSDKSRNVHFLTCLFRAVSYSSIERLICFMVRNWWLVPNKHSRLAKLIEFVRDL